MRKSDLKMIGSICLIIIICVFIVPNFMEKYKYCTDNYPFISSFFKFAILATLGECLGLRIIHGVYNKKGFGILPRAIAWGFTGMMINMAFIIYSAGVPPFLSVLGIISPESTGTISKLVTCFFISLCLNFTFAPFFMTVHVVSTIHINETGGTLRGYFSRFNVGEALTKVHWTSLWGFVFKKTLPLFWVPAHTITFMLPPDVRVLFAAVLGVILGVIMAIASLKRHHKEA